MDILSKSTQGLIQDPRFREAVHKVLDQEPRTPVTVTISQEEQVEITKVPSTSTHGSAEE